MIFYCLFLHFFFTSSNSLVLRFYLHYFGTDNKIDILNDDVNRFFFQGRMCVRVGELLLLY